jgi:hypothetical protein
MGRIIYGPHVGVGDIAGVGPGTPFSALQRGHSILQEHHLPVKQMEAVSFLSGTVLLAVCGSGDSS